MGFFRGLTHHIPDGLAVDLDGERLRLEPAPTALGAEGRFPIVEPADAAQPVAPGTGSVLGVEGKKTGVQGWKADPAGGADASQAENLFVTVGPKDNQGSASLLKGMSDFVRPVRVGQAGGHKIDRVLMVSA